ncbi:MAG: DUF262 domain-containing protein [Gallionella sp.]|nr:DUF262 domain-containing protein [Gallionella sp.]MDD4945501.1 DUF262 domain-containing protein [Gallionella sp.]
MARNIAPQDISWFLDLNKRGLLDLSPPYQRHSVWTPKERRYFLDTIFNGYPCPPLFLYKSLSDEGVATYHVVDGKQRLETIINFVAGKITLSHDMQDAGLAGKKWKNIDVEQRKKYWNYQLAVEMLDTVDNAVVKEIFDRYNRTSKNLERQELRHAKFDGWFATFAEDEAKKEEWRSIGIVTTANARRMKDVQFISELMVVLLKGQLSGFDQDELDTYYADYDSPTEMDPNFSEDEFIEKFERIKRWILELEKADGVVSSLGRTSTNFYSLWCFGALSDNLDALSVAPRYKEFMESIVAILKAENPEEWLAGAGSENNRHQFNYAQNARGANTELPQRLARHKALLSFITGEEPADENQ